jgi:AraC-like DNA-binding protein
MPIRTVDQLKGEKLFRPHLKIFVNRQQKAFELPQHTHDFIEITYVKQGSGYQHINNETVPVKKGDLFVLPVGTSHVYRTSKANKLSVINCVFQLEALGDKLSFLPEDSLLFQCLHDPAKLERPWLYYDDKTGRFLDLFETMFLEFHLAFVGYENMLTSLLVQLLTLIYRTEAIPENLHNSFDKVDEIIHYMKSRYYEDITIEKAARLVYMSASHLQRLFKQATGQTFNRYLQNIRIEKSRELLKTTTKSVQQIANQVGYQDMKHFHALFRKITGMTPRAYRKTE